MDDGRIERFIPPTLEELIESRKSLGEHDEMLMRNANRDAKTMIGRHGYGGSFQHISMAAEGDARYGHSFAIGPCLVMTVVCGCRYEGKVTCDWCCGAGWLTRHVREKQIEANNKG